MRHASVNLDFHTIPHFGRAIGGSGEWPGARNKRMNGALSFFAQDATPKLILYTPAHIQHEEADQQVLELSQLLEETPAGD